MTGLAARVSRWLVHREPLWLVTGAGAVLDVAAHLVPVVPDAWHPYVTAVVVLLGVISGRAMVSPVKASGGGIPADSPVVDYVPIPTTASNVRMVGAPVTTGGGHPNPTTAVMAEPTTGPQTPSGVSSANPPPDQPQSTP